MMRIEIVAICCFFDGRHSEVIDSIRTRIIPRASSPPAGDLAVRKLVLRSGGLRYGGFHSHAGSPKSMVYDGKFQSKMDDVIGVPHDSKGNLSDIEVSIGPKGISQLATAMRAQISLVSGPE